MYKNVTLLALFITMYSRYDFGRLLHYEKCKREGRNIMDLMGFLDELLRLTYFSILCCYARTCKSKQVRDNILVDERK